MTGTVPELIGERLACRRGERLVFADLSLRVAAGGALVLRGANGSGKTSLLRLIAGFGAPAAGRLCWGAEPVAADEAGHRARLHYVGDRDAVKPALTPRETLVLWSALRGCMAAAIEAALDAFALAAVADWPCRFLSAGLRRRVALARLIVAPAPLWLLDEPTIALDFASQARLEQAIADHRVAGGRVLVATHAPVGLADAATIVLDDFAPRPGDAAAA